MEGQFSKRIALKPGIARKDFGKMGRQVGVKNFSTQRVFMDFRSLTENALTLVLSHRNGRGEFSEASGPDVCLFLTLVHLWEREG